MPQETKQEIAPPSALILISPGCPHCAQALKGLEELVKEGALARLEIVNIAVDPEPATSRGVRSVPWTQIGPFVLEGAQSPIEREAKEASSYPVERKLLNTVSRTEDGSLILDGK